MGRRQPSWKRGRRKLKNTGESTAEQDSDAPPAKRPAEDLCTEDRRDATASASLETAIETPEGIKEEVIDAGEETAKTADPPSLAARLGDSCDEEAVAVKAEVGSDAAASQSLETAIAPMGAVKEEPLDEDHIIPPSLASSLGDGLGDVSGFGGTFHSINTTDDSISVTMDVKDYKPEDLKVSVIGRMIVVEATHGEKKDDCGTIEHYSIRRIPLPKGVQPEAVTWTLTTEGALSIVAKPKDPSPPRTNPIKVEVDL